MGRSLFALLLLVPCACERTERPVNVLLVSVDTLRVDRLACYGAEHPTSPHIDRLAQDGVLFEQAFAQCGVTWPSLTSILTGKYPITHGVRINGQMLQPEHSTLPEMLKAQGYATAAFLTNMSSAPHRGFDHKLAAIDPGRPQWQNDAEATRAACAWLTAPERKAPFFAWLHLVDPHRPYHPPEPFDRSFSAGAASSGPVLDAELDRITVEQRSLGRDELAPILGAYDGQIASTDRFLGEVMAALEASGRAADTLVVLCSDHGEELYDHHQYFYHSPSLYDGVLRIALVLRHPGSLPRGVRVATQVQEIDVLPTVLELLDLPRSPRIEGRSLLALARGAAEADRPAYFEYARGTESKILAIRDGRWKYIHNPEGFTPRDPPYSWKGAQGFHYERGELYDLRVDPREQIDLALEHPEQVQRLRAALEAWHAEKRARQGQSGAMDDQTFETLRQLGYFNAEDQHR